MQQKRFGVPTEHRDKSEKYRESQQRERTLEHVRARGQLKLLVTQLTIFFYRRSTCSLSSTSSMKFDKNQVVKRRPIDKRGDRNMKKRSLKKYCIQKKFSKGSCVQRGVRGGVYHRQSNSFFFEGNKRSEN